MWSRRSVFRSLAAALATCWRPRRRAEAAPAQAARGAPYVAPIKSVGKVDESTVEITAKRADAVILGRDWKRVANQPAGTGP